MKRALTVDHTYSDAQSTVSAANQTSETMGGTRTRIVKRPTYTFLFKEYKQTGHTHTQMYMHNSIPSLLL